MIPRVMTANLFTVLAFLIAANPYQGEVDEALVPEFGVTAGTDPDVLQIGSCTGFNGTLIPIPCTCPPDRYLFIDTLNTALWTGNIEGEPISFSNDPNDKSIATNQLRATACIIVLQNFNGKKGSGCPVASAPNFKTQQQTGVWSNDIFVG
jgi:hypothetical protein